MIGITLDAEQLQNAPAPVRQWIEQQISAALGSPYAAAPVPQTPHLTACTEAQATDILNRIRQSPSAISVFLEFARPGISYGEPPIMAFRLVDVQRRAELETITRLLECLELINQTFAEVCNDPAARFCSFDNEGHCLILPASQQGIAALWRKMIAAHGVDVQRVPLAAE